MPNVSLIRTKLYVRGQKPLSTILKQIQKGVFQHRVDALRKEVERGRPRVDFIQNQLPHFSPSARFQEYCQLEYLVKYTGIIRTDVSVKPEEARKVRQLVHDVPYAYACFLNARGNALVILTKSSHEVIQHWSAGKAIADYYRRRLRRRKGVRAFHWPIILNQFIAIFDERVKL